MAPPTSSEVARRALRSSSVQIAQRRIFNFVDAFDLPHHEFGVANDLQRLWAVRHCILERADQRLVFRKIVRLMSEILAKRGDLVSLRIMDHDAITRGARIATCAAVSMSDEIGWRKRFHAKISDLRFQIVNFCCA